MLSIDERAWDFVTWQKRGRLKEKSAFNEIKTLREIFLCC